MPARAVPFFLALGLALGLAGGGCGARGGESPAAALTPEEEYFVEQYLRVVEARQLAAAGDSLGEARFNYLQEALPADSLSALAAAISAQTPTHWPAIFEEIVRRKQIMESQPPPP